MQFAWSDSTKAAWPSTMMCTRSRSAGCADPVSNAEGVSGFDILLSSVDSAAVVADASRICSGIPLCADCVRIVQESLQLIELQKKPIPIILGLITIVATVNIIGTS